jgi:Immunoglobulin domain
MFYFAVKTQILAFSFGDESVNDGDFATVQCAIVKGDSPVSVTWLFNGTEAERVQGISVLKSGARSKVLNIEAVRAEHSGAYTCVSRNAAGSTNYTAHLHVNGTNFMHDSCLIFAL